MWSNLLEYIDSLIFVLLQCDTLTMDSSCYLLLFDILQHLHLSLQVVNKFGAIII